MKMSLQTLGDDLQQGCQWKSGKHSTHSIFSLQPFNNLTKASLVLWLKISTIFVLVKGSDYNVESLLRNVIIKARESKTYVVQYHVVNGPV